MKGYKVFNPDWTCREKQYSCPGIFKQKGELRLCENGIHFCKKLSDCFSYYDFDSNNKVAEIEAIGEIIEDEIQRKYCTSKIKILRELSWNEVLDLVNTGNDNTGFGNSGNQNTGNYNTGHCNSSNYNTGHYNAGESNSGSCNVGDSNSSYCNTGSVNTGHHNSGNGNPGNYNFGHCNSGSYNFGSHNTGDCNTGDYNTGNHNSGDYNTGDYNTSNESFGCFNTEENKIFFFNKQSDWTYKDWKKSNARKTLNKITRPAEHLSWVSDDRMTEEEKKKYPKYKITKGYLRYREKEELDSLRQEWWEAVLSKEEKESVLNLPNFDARIFKEITGIDVTIEK